MTTNVLVEQAEQPKIPRDSFANRIALIRTELKLNMTGMANLVGVPVATWRTWEKGSQPHDLTDAARRVNAKTGYDLDWLLRGGIPLRRYAETGKLTLLPGGRRESDRQPPARSPLLRSVPRGE